MEAVLDMTKKRKRSLFPLVAVALLLIVIVFTIAFFAPHTKKHVPGYTGTPIVELNGNYPGFCVEDFSFNPYTEYSQLDWLGRAGIASACLHRDMMPLEPRASIADIHPSGWDNTSGIFHRSHLIGYQLTGDDIAENLITGTVFLNTSGMLPFENRVAMYIKNTGNHVLYRVTPLFNGNDLIPAAVQMEAFSLEDFGRGICFNVLIYNIQPEYKINYLTGHVKEDTSVLSALSELHFSVFDHFANSEFLDSEPAAGTEEISVSATYVLNMNTKKFHFPYCDSVVDMKEKNRSDFYGTREDALALGFAPCGACCP